MKSLPKEKRDRLILVFLGTCAILVGLYFGLISFQQKSLEAMTKRRQEEQTKREAHRTAHVDRAGCPLEPRVFDDNHGGHEDRGNSAKIKKIASPRRGFYPESCPLFIDLSIDRPAPGEVEGGTGREEPRDGAEHC